MSAIKKYDVIVLGGGSGGLTCAIGAAKLNKRVLLVERRKIGGECTWSGCVPSKAFIQYSKETSSTKENVLAKVRQISEDIYSHESPEIMQSYGIDVIMGEASFKTQHSIEVDGEEIRGEKIVISTGTSPFVPIIKGLTKENLLTNDNFFLQEKLPDSIVFIGAGVISIELSLPLARLGVKVSILEKNDDILKMTELAIAENMKKTFQQYNIDLYVGVDIEEINNNEILFKQGNKDLSIKADKFFVASGRQANIAELKLETVGIAYTQMGVTVNDYLQTSVPHIFAVGDVVGPMRFSHVAGVMGEIFVRNLIMPWCKKKYNYGTVPYVVFTDPEFAQVGITEQQARASYGDKVQVYEFNQHDSERAIISLESKFYVKITTHKGLIVGATVMGAKAGEMANLLQWFYSSKTPLHKLSSAMMPYPSYGDFLRKVAKQAFLRELFAHPIVSLFRSKK